MRTNRSEKLLTCQPINENHFVLAFDKFLASSKY